MKTVLYGASDDLIELDGEIRDEKDWFEKGSCSFLFSDGTCGKIVYTGTWDIYLKNKGTLFLTLETGVDDDDTNVHTTPDTKGVPNYSDALVLKDGIEWVKLGNKKYTKS